MSQLAIDDLPDAEGRFELEECLGTGVCGKVYSAVDTGAAGRRVAIKMQRINKENIPYIQEEFQVLEAHSSHPNIPDFYGVFRKVGEQDDEVWFVLELCDGGPVTDLVNGLLLRNRRMVEEHIAYILKETVKALLYLHENRIMHRDLKASNILLTKEGEVKLADFGLARHLSSTLGKSESCIGSPCWMAPEVVIANHDDEESGYGNRADVWALGITAIELGDGQAPFVNMHPTRAMFQIVRNPPPTLYRPTNWSETYNDFINECLVKNPEHRPYLIEVMEHPFLSELPDNNYHLGQEIKSLLQDSKEVGRKHRKNREALVHSNYFKRSRDDRMEKMYVEDLAALDKVSEEIILQELHARMKQGQFHTFVGDVLLILNPSETKDIYNKEFHKKYNCKSRSDNPPHIFAVADGAYQDALHHILPQNIVLAGESGSGKTTNYLHLLEHLLFLGHNFNINEDRIKNAVKLIHSLTHASTPFNDYSTRCVFKTEIIFGRTGKVSGAVFKIHQLEKWRVSSIDMSQSNYHILYYLYDGLEARNDLEKYNLSPGRSYRYMRINDVELGNRPRNNPEENVQKFKIINEILGSFEFSEEQVNSIFKSLAAVLVLGNVRFKEGEQGVAEIENQEVANKVAQLLNIDEKKLCWALTNYCLIKQGTAVRRRHNCDEARDARDVLANTIYYRTVDYVINYINYKLSYGRKIFGEKYSIRILDLFGFECFKENQLPQLFINCFNEQLHYHYLQRIFAWEALEMNEEGVPHTPIHYYDNKNTLDQILCKPEGVITLIDEASKMSHSGEYIIEYLNHPEREHIKVLDATKFSIAHYTGKVTYDAKEMPDRNRDFLPPDVIETMRLSKNKIIKSMFSNKLTRTGNLFTSFDEETKGKFKFSSSSSDDDNLNRNSEQQFSQIKKMRTAASTFRSLCLDILKELSIGGGSGGTHFVRCVRTNLEGKPNSFLAEIVKQQIRAMAVVETAKARQKGFPHRVSFNEFIRRYKFLAFDFDENVEVSRDNCRLLLVRLKMEGWLIGKSKVFLKYYNEEYLARLYETQVKKIVKIQCIMRGFLVKMKMKKRTEQAQPRRTLSKEGEADGEMTEEQAALVLQKAYRGVASKKAYGNLVNDYEKLDADTCRFIRYFCQKWKAKSMFQVLLQYRAARYQDLFNFAQQVHLFNQNANHNLQKFNNNIGLELVDKNAQPIAWLGEQKPNVLKLPFRLDEIPFFDTSYMCDPLSNPGMAFEKEEPWDSPFRWRNTVSSQITTSMHEEPKISISKPYSHTKTEPILHRPSVDYLINLPYNRDPNIPVRRLSSMAIEPDYVNCNIQPPSDYLKPLHPPPPPLRNTATSSSNYSYKHKTDNLNNNSQPANKDFEYIKPQKSKPTSNVNPIAELKSLGRRESASEDDPPFNFQGMLRKTNNRSSIKKVTENVRTFSFKGRQNKQLSSMETLSNNNGYDSRKGSLRKHRSVEIMNNREKMQLGPGLFMEGVVADL